MALHWNGLQRTRRIDDTLGSVRGCRQSATSSDVVLARRRLGIRPTNRTSRQRVLRDLIAVIIGFGLRQVGLSRHNMAKAVRLNEKAS